MDELPQNTCLNLLVSALDTLGVGALAQMETGCFLSNVTADDITGYDSKEISGRRLEDFFLLIDPATRSPLEALADDGVCRDVILINPQGNEKQLKIVRLRGQCGQWRELFLFRDALAESAAGACFRRNHRIELLAQLVGGVSHDLNNLLGGIMGCAELLIGRLPDADSSRRLAESVVESSRSASILNQRMLNFCVREKAPQRELFAPVPLIRDAVDLLRRSMDRRIVIEVRLNAGGVYLQGDSSDFTGLLLSLGLLSREQLANGGRLEIGGELLRTADGEQFRLLVCDNGSGMPESALRRVRSEIANPDLAGEAGWVWRTVKDFGAKAAVSSRVGQGTEIELLFPVAQPRAVEQAQPVPVVSKPASGSVVLVVDDEEHMRAAVCAMLHNLGYEVLEASSGTEAVKIYHDNPGRIDLVLLDLIMPGLNGRETYLAIRQLNPRVRVVVASGFARNNAFTQLSLEGVAAFLRKPFSLSELASAMEVAARSGPVAPVSPPPAAVPPVSVTDAATASTHEISLRGENPVLATPRAGGERGRLSALLVEDDDVLREVLASLLENRGYDVMALGSGMEAGIFIQNGGGAFSICLFDLHVPGLSGLELCRQVKQRKDSELCYVLVMTGLEPQNVYKSVLAGGADDFLAKPFNLDLLAVRLDVAENSLKNNIRRVEAEKALRLSEERMALAIDNAGLGIMEADLETYDVVVSDIWRRLTGCPVDFPGGPLAYLRENIHPDDYALVFRGVDYYVANSGKVLAQEFRLKAPGRGYIWILAAGKATRKPSDGVLLSGFFQDVTARKYAELSQERQRKVLEDMVMERTEELVRINQELVLEMEARDRAEQETLRQQRKLMDTEKLASLGTLVSGVGHEINNPTQFIMLNMPFLEGAWESALPVLDEYYSTHPDFRLRGVPYGLARERLPVMARDILEGAERIEKIVRELKDYARQGAEEAYERVELRKIADSACTLLAHFIRQHTDHFIIESEVEELMVRANPVRVEQIIINLVQNACLALSGKDKVIRLILQPEHVRGGVEIIVEDEGCGIEERHMRHLTDPFFTTRQSSGGTGLGLSICDRIVHNHQGEMTITSELGRGTRVTVWLPADPEGGS